MSAIFILVAALIFLVDSLGAWKWEDFEPQSLGLFFLALGLLWGPAWAFIDSHRGTS